jgi:hypothetical protein
VILPALMQEVQTLSRLGVTPMRTRIDWMLGFQRRGVRRCEWEMLLPKPGPLPQTSQLAATVNNSNVVCVDGADRSPAAHAPGDSPGPVSQDTRARRYGSNSGTLACPRVTERLAVPVRRAE